MAEVLVASGLGALLLAAILTAFLFITRTGMNIQNYTDMESQSRTAMETFAQDVRMAAGVRWNSNSSLTLTLQDGAGNEYYTYAYDRTAKTFSRQQVSDPVTQAKVGAAFTLITGIKPNTFEFTAYKIDTGTISLTNITDLTHQMTKQVQIALETERTSKSLATSTNKVISARFILRNKKVTA